MRILVAQDMSMKTFLKAFFLIIVFSPPLWHLEATSQRLTDFTAMVDQTADPQKFTITVTTILTKLTPKGTLPKEVPYYKEQVDKVFNNAKTHPNKATSDIVDKLIAASKLFFTHPNLATKTDAQNYEQWLTKVAADFATAKSLQSTPIAAPTLKPAYEAEALKSFSDLADYVVTLQATKDRVSLLEFKRKYDNFKEKNKGCIHTDVVGKKLETWIATYVK